LYPILGSFDRGRVINSDSFAFTFWRVAVIDSQRISFVMVSFPRCLLGKSRSM
jgi:hypothetical protein